MKRRIHLKMKVNLEIFENPSPTKAIMYYVLCYDAPAIVQFMRINLFNISENNRDN